MKLYCLLLLWINYCCVMSAPFHKQWHLWKREHSKKYPNESEETVRHSIWLANKRYINEHNKEEHKHGYTLKMNHLGDLVILL